MGQGPGSVPATGSDSDDDFDDPALIAVRKLRTSEPGERRQMHRVEPSGFLERIGMFSESAASTGESESDGTGKSSERAGPVAGVLNPESLRRHRERIARRKTIHEPTEEELAIANGGEKSSSDGVGVVGPPSPPVRSPPDVPPSPSMSLGGPSPEEGAETGAAGARRPSRSSTRKWARAILRRAKEETDEPLTPLTPSAPLARFDRSALLEISGTESIPTSSSCSSLVYVSETCLESAKAIPFWCRSLHIISAPPTIPCCCFGVDKLGRGTIVVLTSVESSDGPELRFSSHSCDFLPSSPCSIVGIEWSGIEEATHSVLIMVGGESEGISGVWSVQIEVVKMVDDTEPKVGVLGSRLLLAAGDVAHCVVLEGGDQFAVCDRSPPASMVVADVRSGEIKLKVRTRVEYPFASCMDPFGSEMPVGQCLLTFRLGNEVSSVVVRSGNQIWGEYALPLSDFHGFPLIVVTGQVVRPQDGGCVRLACGLEIPAIASKSSERFGIADLDLDIPENPSSSAWSGLSIEPSSLPPCFGHFATMKSSQGPYLVVIAFPNGILLGFDVVKQEEVFRVLASPSFQRSRAPPTGFRSLRIAASESEVVSFWSVERMDGRVSTFVAVHSCL